MENKTFFFETPTGYSPVNPEEWKPVEDTNHGNSIRRIAYNPTTGETVLMQAHEHGLPIAIPNPIVEDRLPLQAHDVQIDEVLIDEIPPEGICCTDRAGRKIILKRYSVEEFNYESGNGVKASLDPEAGCFRVKALCDGGFSAGQITIPIDLFLELFSLQVKEDDPSK